jgi:hypothetical protein
MAIRHNNGLRPVMVKKIGFLLHLMFVPVVFRSGGFGVEV